VTIKLISVKPNFPKNPKGIVSLKLKLAKLDFTIQHKGGMRMGVVGGLSCYLPGAASISIYTNVLLSRHFEFGHRC
jgi:hypothetical protein